MNSIELAKKIRMDCIEICHGSHSVHIGGSLSMSDILAVLYADVLKYDTDDIRNDARDRLIISKGHACSAVYAALAEVGFISKNELFTQYQNGSIISGHISHKVSGIEVSTGSLGHGLPIACGMAYAAKYDNKKHKVYVILGDGECEEGTTWEASMFANHEHLSNLTVIIDNNSLQATGSLKETVGLNSISSYMKVFGYDVYEVDGHNHKELKNALTAPLSDRPKCIIAHTIKGKGISYMENNIMYHSNKISDDLYVEAKKEMEDTL